MTSAKDWKDLARNGAATINNPIQDGIQAVRGKPIVYGSNSWQIGERVNGDELIYQERFRRSFEFF